MGARLFNILLFLSVGWAVVMFIALKGITPSGFGFALFVGLPPFFVMLAIRYVIWGWHQ